MKIKQKEVRYSRSLPLEIIAKDDRLNRKKKMEFFDFIFRQTEFIEQNNKI